MNCENENKPGKELNTTGENSPTGSHMDLGIADQHFEKDVHVTNKGDVGVTVLLMNSQPLSGT